jgi:hypothetical protein
MGRTACTEPQCLYKGTLYLYLSACTRAIFTFTSVPVQGYTLPLPQCLYKGDLYLYLSACTRVIFTFTSVPVQGWPLTLPQCLYKGALNCLWDIFVICLSVCPKLSYFIKPHLSLFFICTWASFSSRPLVLHIYCAMNPFEILVTCTDPFSKKKRHLNV